MVVPHPNAVSINLQDEKLIKWRLKGNSMHTNIEQIQLFSKKKWKKKNEEEMEGEEEREEEHLLLEGTRTGTRSGIPFFVSYPARYAVPFLFRMEPTFRRK